MAQCHVSKPQSQRQSKQKDIEENSLLELVPYHAHALPRSRAPIGLCPSKGASDYDCLQEHPRLCSLCPMLRHGSHPTQDNSHAPRLSVKTITGGPLSTTTT